MPDDLFGAHIAELQQREARIENAERDSYLARGRELAAIRDGKLYRDRYQTFEAYCEERWEMHHSRVYQLIDAARFASTIVDLPLPARESHIRPLLGLDKDEDRLAVWREVLDAAGGPRNIKAAYVEDAVAVFLSPALAEAAPAEGQPEAPQEQRERPTATEARKEARETGQPVIARDGKEYDGRTAEEERQSADESQLFFKVIEAIEALASVSVSPADYIARLPNDDGSGRYLDDPIDQNIKAATAWLNEFARLWEGRHGSC